jgi:hypothetical protein
MIRTSLGLVLAAVLLAAWPARAAQPPAKPQPGPKTTVRGLIALLQREIDLKDAPDKLKLKEILELTATHLTTLNMGREVGILLDTNAFKAEQEEVTTEALLGEDVDIPVFPKRMVVGRLLRLALGKLPTRNATYLVRPGWLEITTVKAASSKGLLLKKVSVSFEKRPLDEALQELSDLTGASIVIDGRLGDKSKALVTATFLNDTNLAGALRVLTDMADVRVVVLEDAIYVTSPENAQKLRAEKAKPLVRPRPADNPSGV